MRILQHAHLRGLLANFPYEFLFVCVHMYACVRIYFYMCMCESSCSPYHAIAVCVSEYNVPPSKRISAVLRAGSSELRGALGRERAVLALLARVRAVPARTLNASINTRLCCICSALPSSLSVYYCSLIPRQSESSMQVERMTRLLSRAALMRM
jgi:hypothetical protein